jgi:hypothetical protein
MLRALGNDTLRACYRFGGVGRSPIIRQRDGLHMKSDEPLSLVDVGRSSSVLKRVFRGAWVLAANAFVAWAMFSRLRSVGFPELNLQLCFEFVLEVILPIIGIGLEIVNWKFAKSVNVGCFMVAGCFWLVGAIWWHSDPFFGVLLIVALGLLVVAGLTEIVSRLTQNEASYPVNS